MLATQRDDVFPGRVWTAPDKASPTSTFDNSISEFYTANIYARLYRRFIARWRYGDSRAVHPSCDKKIRLYKERGEGNPANSFSQRVIKRNQFFMRPGQPGKSRGKEWVRDGHRYLERSPKQFRNWQCRLSFRRSTRERHGSRERTSRYVSSRPRCR